MKNVKIRYSKQRELILNNIKNRCDHPTAEMIYNDLKNDHPTLSLGTVYRNLSQLSEYNQIKRIDCGDSMIHYDGNTDFHMHFFCKNCLNVYDLDSHTDIQDMLQSTCQHQIDNVEVIMSGICEHCLNENSH